MDVLALVESPGHVCCRYRIAAFRASMASAGHRLHVEELRSGPWARWRQLGSSRRFDATIVQRKLLPIFELRRLRANARRLVFDFDDAVFARDSYSARGSRSRKRSARFARMMTTADAVIAGNEFLVARAISAGALADRVVAIPTCVDPTSYPSAPHEQRERDAVRMVWIGSSSTLQGIEARGELWDRLGREVPGLILRIVCDRFPELRGIEIERLQWSEATEAAALSASDIGVSWVPDDAWSRGKCGLKVLQFMAAGLPVVTNPVGVHQEMVEPGQTGFLPSDDDGWVDAIRQLASNPESRRSMGRSGRDRVFRDYSVDVWCDRWVAAVVGELPRTATRGQTPHSGAVEARRRLGAP